MKQNGERTFVVDLAGTDAVDCGIFTWDIVRDLVYGDSVLAELFGLAAKEVSQGMPLKPYLDRVHPEDRPVLAKTITQTILGERAHAECRPKTLSGRSKEKRAAWRVPAQTDSGQSVLGSRSCHSGLPFPASRCAVRHTVRTARAFLR